MHNGIDERAVRVIRRLQRAGYGAFLVGGCVRDMLMGRQIHDYDAATSALPEQVTALFENTVPTGIRHGTVTVWVDGLGVEVTTFRSESVYTDGRHPDAVRFERSIETDLSRRDFTVNAMALSADGEIIDIFGGRADIEGRIIRTVGDPAERFGEDALRMYRCVRFAAVLGFEIDGGALRAMKSRAPLRESVSRERIREEIEKTLMSPRPHLLETAAWAGLLYKKGTASAGRLDDLPENRFSRWGGFFAWLGDENADLRLDKRLKAAVTAGLELCGTVTDRLSVKKIIARRGYDVAYAACGAAQVLGAEDAGALPEEILASGECCTVSELAVKGADLVSIGFEPGKRIGQVLEKLLDMVLLEPEKNSREALLDSARQML